MLQLNAVTFSFVKYSHFMLIHFATLQIVLSANGVPNLHVEANYPLPVRSMTPNIIKPVIRMGNSRVSDLKPVALICWDLVSQDLNPLINALVTSLYSYTNQIIKDSICRQGFDCINVFMTISRVHDKNTEIARQT